MAPVIGEQFSPGELETVSVMLWLLAGTGASDSPLGATTRLCDENDRLGGVFCQRCENEYRTLIFRVNLMS